MITDFDDFCLWVYIIVDDIRQQIAFVQASRLSASPQRQRVDRDGSDR